MFSFIKRVFAPPVFPGDEEKTRIAGFLNISLWLGIFTSSIALILAQFLVVPENRAYQSTVYAIQAGLWIVLQIVMRRGAVRASSLAFITLIYISMTNQLIQRADILSGIGVVNFFLIISLSTLLLREIGIIVFTLLSIVSLFAAYYASTNGLITQRLVPPTPFAAWVFYTLIYIIASAVLFVSSNSLRRAVRQIRESEKNIAAANSQLQELNRTLEQRITERTNDLQAANTHNEHRAHLFQAVAQVARTITSVHDIEALLPNIANLISERFGFYHAGIFLIDEANEYAVLSATNSEGGRRMLERGHKLRVGQVGIVGYVAGTGTPRIALDTGTDAVFFNNPDLPDTRSEMALPLQVGNTIVGVLDVQSTEPNAFDQDDISILTTLADQVTVAIQNAKLFRETQTALAESQALFGEFVQRAWKSASKSDQVAGYRFTGTTPTPLTSRMNTPEIRTALEKGETVTASKRKENTLAVPVKLRDEVIAVLNVNTPLEREWDPDEVDIIEAAAERLALALENATLLEDSRRRAARERTISEMSAKIVSSTEMDAILRTAVEELGRQISGAQVFLELESNE
ncbi:MAG: GAF domain-containing protein [Chloroflexi bacterium]|nr:GAF domain-containing protein [Chloroflexota bacterium]